MRQFTNQEIKTSLIEKLNAQIAHYQGIISVISQPGNAPEKKALIKSHGQKHPITITRLKEQQITDLKYLIGIAQMDQEEFEEIAKDLHLFISDGNKKTGDEIMTFSIFFRDHLPLCDPPLFKNLL